MFGRTLPWAPAALVCMAFGACGDIDVHTPSILVPAGVIQGSVLYSGPPPCVQSVYSTDDNAYHTHIIGSAVMLIFNEQLLPPPDGLGTTARSFGAVAGDVLFDSIQGQLPTPADGQVACPPANAPTVSVSAPWSVGPLEAGRFQVRAFYDYDGDFSPVLKIHQLPTEGDVGGGALENPAQAVAGAKPKYETIVIGNDDGTGHLVVPDSGALVSGVTVNLGLVLPFARPISFITAINDERPNITNHQSDPNSFVMVVDQLLSVSPTNPSNAAKADKEFLRLQMQAGVPDSELNDAIASPISLQADEPYNHFHAYPQTDATGAIVDIPETPASGTAPIKIPSLFPEAIMGKLDVGADPTNLTSQANPAVLINGLVTTGPLVMFNSFKQPKDVSQLTINVRPSAVCLDPLDQNGGIVLVTPSFMATDGETVIGDTDIANLKTYLSNQFSRPTSNIQVVEGCLPPGSYSINLVYDTGQAWTLPNEAGVCQTPLEAQISGADGKPACRYQDSNSVRPLLTSQNALLKVHGANDPTFCEGIAAKHMGDPLPASQYLHGVPLACLTTAEQADPATLQKAVTQ